MRTLRRCSGVALCWPTLCAVFRAQKSTQYVLACIQQTRDSSCQPRTTPWHAHPRRGAVIPPGTIRHGSRYRVVLQAQSQELLLRRDLYARATDYDSAWCIADDPSVYSWRNTGWAPRPFDTAIIYEMHVGSYTPEGTFRSAAEKLAHVAECGFTMVQLMPLTEHSDPWWVFLRRGAGVLHVGAWLSGAPNLLHVAACREGMRQARARHANALLTSARALPCTQGLQPQAAAVCARGVWNARRECHTRDSSAEYLTRAASVRCRLGLVHAFSPPGPRSLHAHSGMPCSSACTPAPHPPPPRTCATWWTRPTAWAWA